MLGDIFWSDLFSKMVDSSSSRRIDKMRAALREHRKRSRKSQLQREEALKNVLSAIEFDIDTLALLLAILIALLKEKGIIRKGDIKALLLKVDKLDGAEDGRLDIRVLRKLLGLSETPQKTYGSENSTTQPDA